jgi:hypothetical protein
VTSLDILVNDAAGKKPIPVIRHGIPEHLRWR